MSGNFGLEGGLGLLGGRVRGVSLSNQELELPSFIMLRAAACAAARQNLAKELCARPKDGHHRATLRHMDFTCSSKPYNHRITSVRIRISFWSL